MVQARARAIGRLSEQNGCAAAPIFHYIIIDFDTLFSGLANREPGKVFLSGRRDVVLFFFECVYLGHAASRER